ncbi:hypothetical protein MtrunA17_Chr6g0477521 [Medicago truncatula]|uniref:Uncharacterized protein n=1 Tax=Medicago truncatula TaxID=3880 RepID=A0A396HI15_MEDTR|nr:hypothetical protein MtrunA17_Chr6g0477521 [Medicago truncatula]
MPCFIIIANTVLPSFIFLSLQNPSTNVLKVYTSGLMFSNIILLNRSIASFSLPTMKNPLIKAL